MTDQSTERALYYLICDLVTARWPDPSDHHTVRSEAIERLRRAKRAGFEAFVAHAVTASVPPKINTATPMSDRKVPRFYPTEGDQWR